MPSRHCLPGFSDQSSFTKGSQGMQPYAELEESSELTSLTDDVDSAAVLLLAAASIELAPVPALDPESDADDVDTAADVDAVFCGCKAYSVLVNIQKDVSLSLDDFFCRRARLHSPAR